jgi:hypothetical protein
MSKLVRFAERRPVLAAAVSFLLVTLPGSISSIWSLVNDRPLAVVARERLGGAVVPSFSAYWITIPLGLAMFLAVLYVVNRKQQLAFNYAYGLAFKGIYFGYDRAANNKLENEKFQLGLNLVNAIDGPLKYQVDQIDIIVGDRTHAKPEFPLLGGVIARGTDTNFLYPAFKRGTPVVPQVEGIIKYLIRYGHPDSEFSRIAKKELKIMVNFGKQPGVAWTVISESDEAI